MSHVATIELEIKDLGSLSAACEELGLEFKDGQKTFKWYGRWANDYAAENAAYKNGIDPKDYGKCEHAIAMKGNKHAYEIGLCKVKGKEGYILAFDFFAQQNNITRLAGGETLPKLRQLYAANVAAKAAKRAGWGNVKVEWNKQTGRPFVTGIKH